MRAFITTVAGMATRFCEDLSSPIPKCIYSKGNSKQTLLYRMLSMVSDYDTLIIVGGFMYEELEQFVETTFPESLKRKIRLVNNQKYAEYGSGWSLYLGLKELFYDGNEYSEVLFAEGDLFISYQDFENVINCKKDLLTTSPEPIIAKKSVVLYFDINGVPHYIYDTNHGALRIDEPFISVYNSGQVWKFRNVSALRQTIVDTGEEKQKGTNLVLINNYFASSDDLCIIQLNTWVNTNTIKDFDKLVFD